MTRLSVDAKRPHAGVAQKAMTLWGVVRRGESPQTVKGLPPLTVNTPACGPLWRLFDGERLHPHVRRQAQALCPRCGLNTTCSKKIAPDARRPRRPA